jgi:hypothetical protein
MEARTISPESDQPFVSPHSVAVCTGRHTPLRTAHPLVREAAPSASCRSSQRLAALRRTPVRGNNVRECGEDHLPSLVPS